MSNRDLKDKLQQIWANKKMAHFYIVQPSPSQENPRDYTREWINDFLSFVLQKEKNISRDSANERLKLGHSDILFVRKEDPHKNYSVKDECFHEFFRFQNFSNLELKHRFIVIEDAQSITTILANKLLKTLEEPAANTTIFLLDPFRHEILPTINSRAIFLRLPSSNNIETIKAPKNISEYFKSLNLEEDLLKTITSFEQDPSHITPLFEYLRSNKSFEIDFIKHLTDYVALSELRYESKRSFLDALQWYEKASTFNNYSPEKLTGLLHSLTVHN